MSGLLGISAAGALAGFTPPPSQRGGDRQITFALEIDGALREEVTLGLRPEDFSRTDPSRVTVHHTLGGAWADNFGPGLPQIQISGTTGWRGGRDGTGEERWVRFRDTVYNRWHTLRREALETGRDPSRVKLIYADGLSQFVCEVAPLALTLRRSRSRPLLISFSLSMVALDQNEEQLRFLQGRPAAAGRGGAGGGGLLASAVASINRLRAAIANVRRWLNATIVAPIRDFLRAGNSVILAAMGAVRDVRNLSRDAAAIPILFAASGMNLFRTLAAAASLPAQIRADLMGVGAAFSNLWCFLLRSRATRLALADYNALYGASNCSSGSGGRPVSPLLNRNPWTALPPPARLPGGIVVTGAAQGALRQLAGSDPVSRPLSTTAAAAAAGAAAAGTAAPAVA